MLQLTTFRRYLPTTISLIAAAALSVGGVLVGRSWLAAHDAAVHLAATMQVQDQILTQANDRQRERDASLAAALAEIAKAKRNVSTPAQAALAIPQVLPPLPVPIRLEIPPSTPEESQPPAVAVVPQPDLKPIYDYLEDCRACQASLAVTRDNLADERNKLAAVTIERDAAVKAARGGGFWSRLRHNAKWFAIGAAAGALAAAASPR